ncbi:hypothetical protein RCJ22_23900 [Vibrio sp. FNV 38]|nr:hypothetical protein [Vibrio sp. FNV 38]
MNEENNLHSHLRDIGFALPNASSLIACQASNLTEITDNLQPIYDKTCLEKPELGQVERLVGLFSYYHHGLLQQFDQQQGSLKNVLDVFEQQLPLGDKPRFSAPIITQFWLATHLWLFVQGRMNLDYSLANDHAIEVSTRLSNVTKLDMDALRCELNKSYYQGIALYQRQNNLKPLWKKWFEKWLN